MNLTVTPTSIYLCYPEGSCQQAYSDLKPPQTGQDIGTQHLGVIHVRWGYKTVVLRYLHVSLSHSGEYTCIITALPFTKDLTLLPFQ